MMKQDFKNVAYMSVFVLIVGAGFYLFDFYDSAFFTLLVGLTLLAIYHAGLYNRGIIEDNTIISQQEIIERDKDLIDFLHGHIGFLEDTNNLPQMQSAPYVIVTNGADRFTLYSNFLPIDRCGEGDGAGDVEVVGEGTAVYLFGQAVVAGREVEQADMSIDGG